MPLELRIAHREQGLEWLGGQAGNAECHGKLLGIALTLNVASPARRDAPVLALRPEGL
jgi:hypothetical protein